MRIAVLIAASAAALTLTACNRAEEPATDAAMTEAAEASGAAVDTSAMTAEQSVAAAAAAANAPSSQGQMMDPATATTMSGGAMAPVAQPGDTAGNNVTGTERRLDPAMPAPAH